MKKMVILYPAHFEQAMGGAEMQISYLVKYLKNQFEIHYIYCDRGTVIANNDGVFLHPIKRIRIPALGQAWFIYGLKIFRILSDIKPDIIYTRLGSSWMFFASRYAKLNNIKHIHAFASDFDLQRCFFTSFYPLGELVENIMINAAIKNGEKFIVQNTFQLKTLLSRFGKDSLLIRQMTPAVSIVNEKSTKDDILRIVWVANLKPIKQPNLYIDLCRSLSTKLDNIEFIMVGKPNQLYDKIISEIGKDCKNFTYKGLISNDEVNEILNSSDILVNTSLYEGFSNTFVQAWMNKCIVISMNSNPDNILLDYHVGFLTPTLDEMADKIIYMYAHRDELSEMCDNARVYAYKYHSLESNMPNILEYINKNLNA